MIFFPFVFSLKSMISFDEGPTKNISTIINKGVYLNIPLVFFFDPFSPDFNKEIVEEVLDNNYEVGMILRDETSEETVLEVLEKYEKEFINKSGYKPRLLRLPPVGEINNKTIDLSESKGYIVDIPNLDSEDDQKADIYSFLIPTLYQERRRNISMVFRERYEKSLDILERVVEIIKYKGYQIVPAKIYTGQDITPIKMNSQREDNNDNEKSKKEINNDNEKSKKDNNDNEKSKKDNNDNKIMINNNDNNNNNKYKYNNKYVTMYEILNKNTPYKIRVFTSKDKKIIKEITVEYSTYNKLFIRDLIKMRLEDENEVEEMYREIINVCGVLEDTEVEACKKNGNEKWEITLYSLIVLLLI
ncbi:peptidoglycan N-acetlyglucosamine deacetlyase [Vairimorpha necatrix]|uniref:Peptidoglycan N-acetlyglucosamine deacetlyase n=1 Tax=Vairimorpha necatrix TaxID=6039 RepID=A0AAX4JBZ3_9MICR